MQQTEEARGASQTKGETRQRASDPMTEELAWVDQVARLMEPIPVR